MGWVYHYEQFLFEDDCLLQTDSSIVPWCHPRSFPAVSVLCLQPFLLPLCICLHSVTLIVSPLSVPSHIQVLLVFPWFALCFSSLGLVSSLSGFSKRDTSRTDKNTFPKTKLARARARALLPFTVFYYHIYFLVHFLWIGYGFRFAFLRTP